MDVMDDEVGAVISVAGQGWKRKRYITADEPLRDWMGHIDEYVEEVMRLEGRGDAADQVCPTCDPDQPGVPLYRCTGCCGFSMYCATCVVKAHATRPFCQVEEWHDGSFRRVPLVALGLVVQLNHPDGSDCENAHIVHQDFVVIDTGGVHRCTLSQCGCPGAPTFRQQLMRHRLFPASPNAPRTACTFAVLEQFHTLTCHGKVTMYDYYNALEAMTDSLGTSGLRDRHQVFARCIRQWRYVQMLKQGGRGNDCVRRPSNVLPGELAVRCPACPIPGENLPQGWENVPRDKQYLYELPIAMDACFRLKRRDVSSVAKDPRLVDGGAYMVQGAPYESFLKTVGSQEETTSSCSGLSALEHANTKYAKGYAETGKGIGVCARHEFVQPNGVVPLQAGERYANMDYALGSLLVHQSPRLKVLLSYDIACQFSKNLLERIDKLPEWLQFTEVARSMRFVVPKLHILGHKMACQLLYNIAYLLGGARTDGEGVERPWAHLGPLGTSLRQMGPGSAADTLDDHLNYWNWLKLISLGRFLLRKLLEALKEEAIQRVEFDEFSREQAHNVPAWRAEVLAFELDQESVRNPFEMPTSTVTEDSVQRDLAREEAEAAARGVEAACETSPADFISGLLELENDHRKLRREVAENAFTTTKQEESLFRQRTKLSRAETKVRAAQRVYTPSAIARLERWEADAANVGVPAEDRPLFPPSALSESERTSCIGGVVEVEARLRDAQCASSLQQIRDHLLAKARELRFKNSNLRHQGSTTRARTLLQNNDEKIKGFACKYIDAREALLQLRSEDVRWRAMDVNRDLRCMEERSDLPSRSQATGAAAPDAPAAATSHLQRLRNATGEGRRVTSWIWYGAGTSDPDAEGTELYEGVRVEWCKAFARLRRWQEQILLLREEMRRTEVSLKHRASLWGQRASSEARDGALGEGARAYALSQQRAYNQLRDHFCKLWNAAPQVRLNLSQAIQLAKELEENDLSEDRSAVALGDDASDSDDDEDA
ncbi:hypothetical protein FB107DRAFT_280174 [Schizophyllum commune]